MKILYFNVNKINCQWGSEVHLDAAFNEICCETLSIDYRFNVDRLGQILKRIDVNSFDCLFIQRGDYFPLSILRDIKLPIFFWNSELLVRKRDNHHLIKSKRLKHIFVRTEECKRYIIAKKWMLEHQISILLGAFEPNIYYDNIGIKKDIDVLFIGSRKNRRDKWLSELNKLIPITRISAFGSEQATCFNRAKIVLNVHAEEYFDTETRIYEALACKTLVITEKLSPESPFVDKKHLIECASVIEMSQACSYYLSNDIERLKIETSGYNECFTKHSYKSRAKWLIEIFQNYIIEKEDRGENKANTPSFIRLKVLENIRFYTIQRFFMKHINHFF